MFFGVPDLSRPAVDWLGQLARSAYIPQVAGYKTCCFAADPETSRVQ